MPFELPAHRDNRCPFCTNVMGGMRQVHRLAQAITRAFDPSGLNVFQNNGLTAGQTVAHYHVHIVPSYPGDPPGRIFNSAETERTPIDERLKVAARIIAELRD